MENITIESIVRYLNQEVLMDAPSMKAYRNLQKWLKSLFIFATMAYSSVTTPVHFHVNINEQKLTIDEHTQNLIESILENDDCAKEIPNDESNDDNELMH